MCLTYLDVWTSWHKWAWTHSTDSMCWNRLFSDVRTADSVPSLKAKPKPNLYSSWLTHLDVTVLCGGLPGVIVCNDVFTHNSRSRPLDCEVRGSNPGQGRNLKTKISASGALQRWWRRVTRAGWGQLRRRYIKPEYLPTYLIETVAVAMIVRSLKESHPVLTN